MPASRLTPRAKLQSGRAECPACKRKGLGYAPHPHAFGYKNYDEAVCRYCRKRFKVTREVNYAD
jgi:hypothetical protein